MNPNFENTFRMFFGYGYTAAAETEKIEITDVKDVMANRKRFTTHNFVFR